MLQPGFVDDERGFFSIIDYAVDGAQTQRELIDAFADIQRRWWPAQTHRCPRHPAGSSSKNPDKPTDTTTKEKHHATDSR